MSPSPIRRTLTTGALAALLAAPLSAQFPATEDAELVSGLGQFNGRSVALHGDVAFVGAPGGQFTGQDRFVHAYRKVGGSWILEQTLLPTDGNVTRFGWSLDFDGTTLLVGSTALPGGNAAGRATVYTHDGSQWIGSELPYPPVADNGSIGFGSSVAVDGTAILVGAPLTDSGVFPPGGNGIGAVYAYRFTPAGVWELKQEIKASNPSPNLSFGLEVAVEGDHALVGSNDDTAYALFFELPARWSETQILTPSVASADSSFGEALALDGQRAVVGAWRDDLLPDRGAAFVFERVCGEWLETQRLEAPGASGSFARAVDMEGDALVIGAATEFEGGQNSAGAAYAYRYDGASWQLEQRMTADTPVTFAQLGRDVSLNGDRALVGAISASAGPSGSAFVFDGSPVTSAWTDLGAALAGASTPELRGTSTLTPGAPLGLDADCGLAGAAGVLFAGLAEIHAPFKGGVLVPDPLFQIPVALDGGGSLALAASWPSGIPAGTTLALQAWFLDPSGPVGVTASNALRATAMP